MKEIEKRGNQSESSDQKAPFNVEAHEAQMPIRELAAERTAEGNDHGRKTDK
jgi:hypothetical protein